MKGWPLVSCLASGCLAPSRLASSLVKISVLCCVVLGLGARRSHAQVTGPITADTTLQAEDSIVNTATNGGSTTHTITGGALRDTTLFHSFDQFSVSTDDTAIFSNADALTHIIGRVTGDNISRLDGTIQAGGRANLFLINPAGIIFGPAAQLQIGGSFFASAGEGVRFDDGFIYSARSPNLPPLPSPLLSVSAPIGLVLEDTSGTVQAIAPTLSVAEGQTIALSGSDISLQGAQLTAEGGRIEINSLGNISLLEQSVLDTTGPGGGAIQLQGRTTVTLSDASALISDTLGSQNGDGIQIVADDQLRVKDGSFVGAATSGTGDSSPIEITAADITIGGVSFEAFNASQNLIFTGGRQISDRQTGGIFTVTTGSGRAGDITVRAQRLRLNEGASISTETLGTGRSGDVDITATERIGLNDAGIYAQSLSRTPLLVEVITQTPTGLSTRGIPAGPSGDITLRTAQLRLEESSAISASTLTDSNSGTLTIQATDSIVFRETPLANRRLSPLLANVSIGGNGAAGNILIETGRLVMQDRGSIFSSTGNFTIPFGGPAGDITIVATASVDIVGSAVRVFPSTITSSSRSPSPAGAIRLTTPVLSILDGGTITSEAFEAGQGGAVQIDAPEIAISGQNALENRAVSGIFAASGDRGPIGTIPFIGGPATGSAGTISLNTRSLLIDQSATISVASSELGGAGNLNITAESIRLAEDGSLSAETIAGSGGNIVLEAANLTLDDSRITASSTRDSGGNLSINLQEALSLRNGSLISTEAGTAGAGGNGGDINLNTAFVVAVPSENSDIRANAFEGDGGNVTITARNLLGIDFRPGVLDTPLSDVTASSLFGRNGEVVITELNPDTLQPETELPTETAPPSVARGCRGPGANTGSFVSSGRGGLPTSPVAPLSADSLWQDLAPLDLDVIPETAVGSVRPEPISEPIVEAHQWRRDADGTVTLFAQSTEAAEHLAQAGTCLAN